MVGHKNNFVPFPRAAGVGIGTVLVVGGAEERFFWYPSKYI